MERRGRSVGDHSRLVCEAIMHQGVLESAHRDWWLICLENGLHILYNGVLGLVAIGVMVSELVVGQL